MEFRGNYAFLSNMYSTPIEGLNKLYDLCDKIVKERY